MSLVDEKIMHLARIFVSGLDSKVSYDAVVCAVQIALIERALDMSNKQVEAAKKLGMGRTRISGIMKKYDIKGYKEDPIPYVKRDHQVEQ
jgi:DNA-binding protein Fis